MTHLILTPSDMAIVAVYMRRLASLYDDAGMVRARDWIAGTDVYPSDLRDDELRHAPALIGIITEAAREAGVSPAVTAWLTWQAIALADETNRRREFWSELEDEFSSRI